MYWKVYKGGGLVENKWDTYDEAGRLEKQVSRHWPRWERKPPSSIEVLGGVLGEGIISSKCWRGGKLWGKILSLA